MARRIRSGVQNAYDQNAGFVLDVEDDTGAVLEAPKSRRQLIGAPARPRVLPEVPEACLEFVAVAAGLLDSEGLDGVVGDPGKVRLGAG